ncbi:MAG: hypothetical protein QNJ34_14890 [Xenococcaceae cyanobacterium MO_188.B29]|nr:hypothetical protein [Xenococcaceae cyanobacterium MO_188.B29]
MNSSKLSVVGLGITVLCITTLKVNAQDISIAETNIKESLSFSTKAADLVEDNNLYVNSHKYQLAEVPLNLDRFCRDYPYNSRCANFPPSTRESESQPRRKPTSDNRGEDSKSRFGIAPEVSTLGLGGSVAARIIPELNARVGINGFGVGIDYEETDTTYEGDINLFNVSTLVDYYPFKRSGFHLSAGLVFSDNGADGTANASSGETIEIGDSTFTAEELGSVDAEVSLTSDVAPYLGIGWGNPVAKNKNLGFWFNLGVMFGGSPEVAITPNFGSAATPAIQAEINQAIEREVDDIEDDLDFINIYPVLSLGLYYHF